MTAKDLAKQDLQDINAVFQTKEGRRFLARLLQECGIYRVNACGEQTHTAAFQEGARAVGLTVLGWLAGADDNAAVKVFNADRERELSNNHERKRGQPE